MKSRAGVYLIVISALCLLMAVSCVTQPLLIPDGYWFQKLAVPGAFVATISDPSLMEGVVSLDSRIADRINRASFQFLDGHLIGVIEGDIPNSLFKAGMLLSKDFSKDEGGNWYSDESGSMKIGLIQKDMVVMTTDGFKEASDSVTDVMRGKTIDDETALLMASSQVALYSLAPDRLPRLAVFSGDFSARGISELLLCISDGRLNLIVKFDSEERASAFSRLLRLSYVARLKKSGKEVNLGELRQQLVQDGAQVMGTGLFMEEGEIQRIISSALL